MSGGGHRHKTTRWCKLNVEKMGKGWVPPSYYYSFCAVFITFYYRTVHRKPDQERLEIYTFIFGFTSWLWKQHGYTLICFQTFCDTVFFFFYIMGVSPSVALRIKSKKVKPTFWLWRHAIHPHPLLASLKPPPFHVTLPTSCTFPTN